MRGGAKREALERLTPWLTGLRRPEAIGPGDRSCEWNTTEVKAALLLLRLPEAHDWTARRLHGPRASDNGLLRQDCPRAGTRREPTGRLADSPCSPHPVSDFNISKSP
eukprot:4325462-Prymnesium_polylepis.2